MPEDPSPPLTPARRTDRELIESAGREADAASPAAGVDLHLPSGASLPEYLKEETSVSADSIPGYSIVREIHRGGQGVVYQATQKHTKRQVAIKVMREGPFASRRDKARFEREVEVLAQLSHPNIVGIYDGGAVAGSVYFVMDYIPGQPLDVYMADKLTRPPVNGGTGGWTIKDTLRLFMAICDAVNAAHLRGVIHRDLKPGNIRIDPDGQPHILDFGLAKVPTAGDASVATVTGQFIGSLPWASPEQAEAVPEKIDLRTDVYSLGVILYQMLTGRFPYDVVGNMRDVLDRIMRTEPTRPSTLRRQINDEVETIVLKCLAKDRERRYQSAGELARDIGHYLAGEPLEAKRDSTWYVLRKNLRRYRAPVAVSAGFVLLLAAGLVVSLTLWRHSVRQRDEAQAQRILAQHRLFDGLVGTGDSSVKSKQYAQARQAYCDAWALARQMNLPDIQARLGWLNSYVASPPPLSVCDLGEEAEARFARGTVLCMTKDGPLVPMQRGNTVCLVNPLTGRQVASLAGHTGRVRAFDVSPDGRQFCTGGQDGMRLWDAASQKELRHIPTDALVITCLFSRDGRALFWSEDDGKVAGRDLATSHAVWEKPFQTGIPEAHLFASPDGRWLAAAGGAIGSRLIDARTGKEKCRLHTFGGLAFTSDGSGVLCGHLDKVMRLRDVTSGQPKKVFSTPGGYVFSLAVSADGRLALSGEDDSTVKLWDMATGDLLQVWSGHSAAVTGVAFLPDGRTALSCSLRECLVWNLTPGSGTRSFSGAQPHHAVAISPDGRTALSSGAGGLIWHWDIGTGKALRVLVGPAKVREIAFLPDGKRAVSGGQDWALRLWDLSTGKMLKVLRGHHSEIYCLAISPDGRAALSAERDGDLWLWDLQAGGGSQIRGGGAGPAQILSLCFSPDGHSALIGHRGGTVSLYDLRSGTEIRRVAAHQDGVHGVAFLPDGRNGLSLSADNTLALWDLATEKVRRLAEPQLGWVSSFAVSPDGQDVFCGSFDGAIRLRSTDTGRQLQVLSRHGAAISSLALSRNGRLLLAAGQDGTISVWDFDLLEKYRGLEARAASARDILFHQPQDARAMSDLGEWFAFREADHLAVDCLERARKVGAPVSSLLLGRCYWRLGRFREAHREFEAAMKAGEASPEYLQLCLAAISSATSRSIFPVLEELDGLSSSAYELRDDGKLEVAVACRKGIVERAESFLAKNDKSLLKYRIYYASVLKAAGLLDDAEAQFRAVREAVADAPDEKEALPDYPALVAAYQRWRALGRAGLTAATAPASQPAPSNPH